MSVIQVTNGEDVGAEKGSTRLRPQRFPKTSEVWGSKAKGRLRGLRGGKQLVEMAGIEPASEKFDLQMSTSLVNLFSFAVGRPGQLGQPAPIRWPPKGRL